MKITVTKGSVQLVQEEVCSFDNVITVLEQMCKKVIEMEEKCTGR